jgi:hypothetical protein
MNVAASRLLGPCHTGVPNASRLHATDNVGEPSRQSNAWAHKPWLMVSAIRLDLGTVDVGEL